jgi:hypothetical protein
MVVAAGGGGAGNFAGAGDAGSAGGNNGQNVLGGAAGTLSGGGAGGTNSLGGQNGADGSFGQGGSGGSPQGGGGGAGFFGGGGGAGTAGGGAGGGGGASFVASDGSVVSAATPTSAAAVVSVTFQSPSASLDVSSLSFGSEPQGVASAAQTMTLTNSGTAPLAVSGVLLGGSDASDYLVTNGCQQPVAPSGSCQLEVRFAPHAQGASSATLSLFTNAPSDPAPVALSGTGGSLPQGLLGATGATGPQGPPGPVGKVELITCNTVAKKVRGHVRKVQKCRGQLVSGTVKFTITGRVVRATLSQRRVVFATGASVSAAGGGSLLVLNDTRRVVRGAYMLTLRSRRGHRWTMRRERIVII